MNLVDPLNISNHKKQTYSVDSNQLQYAREPIVTTQSPDSKITIDFYTVNGGAATSIGVLGIVECPLWFKKNIYHE
ncbi:DUF5412 family protein [Oceanobacillus chungangensis]|uniref:DUF5412 family protein n=1 Tax=Oceanobacillus chungangensis TaxID=1229152 RepID=UPI001FEAFFC7|nr:DUF5412 family protein [Oceanobacillus chungangensis]